ncbi:FadR/GntR family transcriptional regulator [Oricola nitratireducens]|uniref:FadR/GntR family transcriptional regulator n=1 Tax=Oricola nitratireducens TaxID=2775868 RepID=UPI001868FA52|nr:FCD domain-containing protein [Oricola nitratireducens]
MSVTGDANQSHDVDGIIEAVKQFQKEGEKLPSERVLADRLNVKRHQLRKALAVLRESGDLHQVQPRRVPAPHPRYSEELVRITNPLEVLEMRMLIEPGLARLASLRASALEIKQIREAAKTPENANSGAVDLSFHLAIVSAARNHLAGEFYKMLRQVGVDSRVRVARLTPTTCPKRIAQRDQEHLLIAEAIAQRDPEAAEAAMRAHLQSVQQQINERSSAYAA